MTRRRRLLAGLAVTAAAVLAVLLHRNVGWAQWSGDVRGLGTDAAQPPDVLVRTRSLATLPRDLLRVPVLRDLLTEDVLFYYEQHPDRLGLQGSLRRIAWEHELQWRDEILSWALDQPADVALWRSRAGSLDYWALALSGRDLAAVVREAGVVALKDRHLSLAGTVTVGEAPVEVYALPWGSGRTLLFAGRGDRVVVLSDPGLLLGDDRNVRPAPAAVVARLLGDDPAGHAALREGLKVTGDPAGHSVAVRTSVLAFGYQRFFPTLEALRFDFDGSTWATRVLAADRAATPSPELWSALPTGPGLCTLLPVEWSEGRELAAVAGGAIGDTLAQLASDLDGPAAVCWYGEGRLQAPLVAARLHEGRASVASRLGTTFRWAIRKPEDETVPARARRVGDAQVWTREIGDVPFAGADAEGRPVPGTMTVTLALSGRTVLFSPDGARVDAALDTLARRYPSVADSLGGSAALGVVGPLALAQLGRSEALVMLPRADEPVFRTAAERHLLPRLEALSRHPGYRLVAAAAPGPDGWRDVAWEELAR